ncbi:F-box FBD LRR-repeat containing protein, putative [Babesia ovata]|uniref:F-box FBD LRR-repeat containing protein, putative n=1 Tax=Babesia ovata TaxID=189622 RepID=A0A2H6K9E3_9APIC|nr:F-box FBD LRR-repeat containing protein, putative [Babesia ovata]GBE59598.1 F-box FBD LRR-repeat containing protein, putative [Babesia ovata]
MATMTAEQLHCCVVLFEVMATRYPVFRLEYGRFQQMAIDRLCAMSSVDQPTNNSLREPPPPGNGSSETAVRKLSSKVQRVYRRVYPYFEAVNIRLGTSRANTAHLVDAAACIQRQHSSCASFQWEQYNALCSNVKQLLRNAELFSLQSTMDFVALLHRNASMNHDAVHLDSEQVHVLAKKLAELNIDSYMVIPKEDGEFPLPDHVDQCVTKLFAVCLETPPLTSLTDCLLALIEREMLNDHLKLLLIPYVSSCISQSQCRMEDLLLLVPHRWLQHPNWLPFWVVYMSALLNSPKGQNAGNIECLSRACDTVSRYLSDLSLDMSESNTGTVPESGAVIGTVDEAPSTVSSPHSDELNGASRMYRWLGQLDEVRLLNITDTEDVDSTSSLSTLLEKRFGVPSHQEGILGGFIANLSKLQATFGAAIQSESSPSNKTSATASRRRAVRHTDNNAGVNFQSSQNGHKNANKYYVGTLMPDRNFTETAAVSKDNSTQFGVSSAAAQTTLGDTDDTCSEHCRTAGEAENSLSELQHAHNILGVRISILQRQLDSIV